MIRLDGDDAGSVIRNQVLAALQPEEIGRLLPSLTRVTLVSGQVLHERDTRIGDVFFMEKGLASLTADTRDSGQVEVGLTGWEGMVGVAVLLNPDAIAAHRAFVQIPGLAWRIGVERLREAVERSPALRDRCLRYVQLLMIQTAQTAACNVRHELPERLARWLLMSHDRMDGDELPLTQEFLSLMLGVRRAGVSVAAGTLQSAGLISQARGRIIVLDRAGLEQAACECYRLVRQSEAVIFGT
jgi:CRP-like cAMP-binding protein